MSAKVVSQITATYRDAKGQDHSVIKKIFEVWDTSTEQWHVTSIAIIYPDAEPVLPVNVKDAWIMPPDWHEVKEVWDYSRRAIVDNREYDTKRRNQLESAMKS